MRVKAPGGAGYEVVAIELSSADAAQTERKFSYFGSHRFGESITALDDIDGDGCGEVLVGDPGASLGTEADVGSAIVFSGQTRVPLYAIHGLRTGDALGANMRSTLDLNGDRVSEFVVSAPQRAVVPDGERGGYRETESGPGYVMVCSGASGKVIRVLVDEVGSSSGFGRSIAVSDGVASSRPFLVCSAAIERGIRFCVFDLESGKLIALRDLDLKGRLGFAEMHVLPPTYGTEPLLAANLTGHGIFLIELTSQDSPRRISDAGVEVAFANVASGSVPLMGVVRVRGRVSHVEVIRLDTMATLFTRRTSKWWSTIHLGEWANLLNSPVVMWTSPCGLELASVELAD